MNNSTMETILAMLFCLVVFLLLILFFPDQVAWLGHWMRREIADLSSAYWGTR